jgi:hypothetical protein
MSMGLADALAQVELEAGRVYRCEVKGRKVEVRVLEEVSAALLPAPLAESDIRLEPWVEFPLPSGTFNVLAKLGPLLSPEIPEIPAEEGPA